MWPRTVSRKVLGYKGITITSEDKKHNNFESVILSKCDAEWISPRAQIGFEERNLKKAQLEADLWEQTYTLTTKNRQADFTRLCKRNANCDG